jgi:uncharacterized protein YndB with AHSA1/START domain
MDADALVKWIPPHGFTARLERFDPKVGGGYRMTFTNFATGHSHSFESHYIDLVPQQRLVYQSRFDDANMPGTMTVTVTVTEVICGTELSIIQEGIPDVIPEALCYLGWQESLNQLANLVEPQIP